jgi:hypothetical protein
MSDTRVLYFSSLFLPVFQPETSQSLSPDHQYHQYRQLRADRRASNDPTTRREDIDSHLTIRDLKVELSPPGAWRARVPSSVILINAPRLGDPPTSDSLSHFSLRITLAGGSEGRREELSFLAGLESREGNREARSRLLASHCPVLIRLLASAGSLRRDGSIIFPRGRRAFGKHVRGLCACARRACRACERHGWMYDVTIVKTINHTCR